MTLGKKGFSSKELIMIIVIVGLLGVFLVPRVLDAIKKSNDDTVIDSVKVFRDEVDKAIISHVTMMGIDLNDGCYYVTKEGNVCLSEYDSGICVADYLEIDISRMKPTGGFLDIESNRIVDMHNIKIEDKFVSLKNQEYYISLEPDTKNVCE